MEDSLRTIGMLASAWGVLLMVQQMYGTQMRLSSASRHVRRLKALQSPGVSRRAGAHGEEGRRSCCWISITSS